MKKSIWKFLGAFSLFILIPTVASPVLAEITEKAATTEESQEQKAETKKASKSSFLKSLFQGRSKNETTEVKEENSEKPTPEVVVETEEKKPNFFQKLFSKKSKTEETSTVEETTTEAKEESSEKPTPEVAIETEEKKPNFFQKLFSKKTKTEETSTAEEITTTDEELEKERLSRIKITEARKAEAIAEKDVAEAKLKVAETNLEVAQAAKEVAEAKRKLAEANRELAEANRERKPNFFQRLFSKRKDKKVTNSGTLETVAESETQNKEQPETTDVQKEKKPNFFQKLFTKKPKETKTEKIAEEGKRSVTEEKAEKNVADVKTEKKANFFQKLFSKEKKKESSVVEVPEVQNKTATKPEEKEPVVEETKKEMKKEVVEATPETKDSPKSTEEKIVTVKTPEADIEAAPEKKPNFFQRLFSRKSKKPATANKELPHDKKDMAEESTSETPEVTKEMVKSEDTAEKVTEKVDPKSKKKETPTVANTWFKRTFSLKNLRGKNIEEDVSLITEDNGTVEVMTKAEKEEAIAKAKEERKASEASHENNSEPIIAKTKNTLKKWFKRSPETKEKKAQKKTVVVKDQSPFHDPKDIQEPKYIEKEMKEDSEALGVVGKVKGKKIGPFERHGKYEVSGTETGLLLPLSNADVLNTKKDIVSVIMQQPALLSVDSYSSVSIHKVITINEIVLQRGRFRLKTLDEAGLWTIRGREMMISLASNTDVVFDMTGTLITKAFILEGKAHCLPKLGAKPIELEAGTLVHDGLSETKTESISDEQMQFLKDRFSLASEKALTAKLKAAGAFKTRKDKNWPFDSKVYSGILCTNCSYAFDSREDYFDVCPNCHINLLETPAPEAKPEDEQVTPTKKKKPNYKWSKWFYGIFPKKSSKK